MRITYRLLFGIVLVLAPALSACGSNEPSAEERAEARARYEARQKEEDAREIADFPRSSGQIIANLEAITERDVSDMEVATAAIRQFDRAGASIRMIESAEAEGVIPVDPEAIAAKDRLKVVLIARQRALFPAMRETYARYMSAAVSGTSANFRAAGAGGKTLRGASPNFTSRSVVVDAHYTLAGQATRFRFTKAEYVYSLTGARDVIELNGGSDSDIG